MDVWYFDVGTGPQGPYLIDELLALWRQGRLGWDARVLREGDPEWRPVRGHGAFIDAIFARDMGTGDAQGPSRAAAPRERRATPTQPVADTQRSPRPIMEGERVTETARAPHD